MGRVLEIGGGGGKTMAIRRAHTSQNKGRTNLLNLHHVVGQQTREEKEKSQSIHNVGGLGNDVSEAPKRLKAGVFARTHPPGHGRVTRRSRAGSSCLVTMIMNGRTRVGTGSLPSAAVFSFFFSEHLLHCKFIVK